MYNIYIHHIQPSDDTEAKDAESGTENKDNETVYNVGDYVELQGKKMTRKGYIRFKGKIESFGDCVGIELDDKITDGNDGKFNSKQYFQCAQGKGTFIKIGKIIKKLPIPTIAKGKHKDKDKDKDKESKEQQQEQEETFPAAPIQPEEAPKKPKKRKKKTAASKGTTTGKKGKKTSTENKKVSSSGSAKKTPSSRRTNTSSTKPKVSKQKTGNSKKKDVKKKKEKKVIDFTIPTSGTNKDKLQFIFTRISDTKSPFKKRVEIMKNTIPIIEDEKLDDATAKYAIQEYKKCFTAQV